VFPSHLCFLLQLRVFFYREHPFADSKIRSSTYFRVASDRARTVSCIWRNCLRLQHAFYIRSKRSLVAFAFLRLSFKLNFRTYIFCVGSVVVCVGFFEKLRNVRPSSSVGPYPFTSNVLSEGLHCLLFVGAYLLCVRSLPTETVRVFSVSRICQNLGWTPGWGSFLV
jgi:hypothetical protein